MQTREDTLRILACVAALTTACSAPALAREPYKEVAGWSLYRNETNCSAAASYRNDEMLMISYNAADKATRVTFTYKEGTSLKRGDKRDIDIILVMPGRRIDNGWRSKEFTVDVLDDGVRALASRWLEPPALSDLKRASRIGFYYNDKLAGAFDLRGTYTALSELELCSMAVHGFNPDDIFAGSDG